MFLTQHLPISFAYELSVCRFQETKLDMTSVGTLPCRARKGWDLEKRTRMVSHPLWSLEKQLKTGLSVQSLGCPQAVPGMQVWGAKKKQSLAVPGQPDK